MVFKKILIGAALLCASAAQAAPVFSDNFDTDTLALNATNFHGGWAVAGGTVDVIGAPGFFDLLPGNGRYVDLDGTTNRAGLLFNSVALTAGVTYKLSFDLAGNNRNAGNDSVEVGFGSGSQIFTRSAADGFQSFSLTYTATTSGLVGFSFADQGRDNQGALLDNVSIAAVPEPETYGMLLGGLALLGVVARRRRHG